VQSPPELRRRISRLVDGDIDNFRSREGIKRAVIDVLREFGIFPPDPKPKKPSPLRLVKSEKSEPPPAA
jgi:hypothetical protein